MAYRIVSEGKLIAILDSLRYVRKKPSTGCYIQCNDYQAEAVAIFGDLYNLPGKNNVPDRPEIFIDEVDGNEVMFRDYVDKRSHSEDITYLEDALCQIDSALTEEG